MADIGFLVSMLEEGTQSSILEGNLLGYKGAIFENLAADVFGKMGRKLYYYHKDSALVYGIPDPPILIISLFIKNQ